MHIKMVIEFQNYTDLFTLEITVTSRSMDAEYLILVVLDDIDVLVDVITVATSLVIGF